MKVFPETSKIVLLSGVLLFGACVETANVNTNQAANNPNQTGINNSNANVAKDDVAELSSLINSPFEFDDSSVWREVNPGTPSDRKLIAVLKFKPEEADEIVKRAETYKPAVAVQMEAESWFPPELIAQSGASGDETIKGNSYAANDFVKAQYTGGKLTRIVNTDYFILELIAN
jgi:hypothetical protein